MKTKTQSVIIAINVVVAPLIVLLIALAVRSFSEKRMTTYINEAANEAKQSIKEGKMSSTAEIERLEKSLNFKLIVITPEQRVLFSSVPGITMGSTLADVLTNLHRPENFGYQFMIATDERNNSPDFRDFTVIIRSEKKNGFDDLANSPFLYFVISMIAIMLMSISVTIGLLHSVTSAITKLDGATKNVSIHNLDNPVKIDGSDEIKSLVHSFNAMRSTIKRTVIKRNNFVMGISHDFKTPLALIKGYAEILEDSLPDITERQEEYIASIGIKIEQIESMLDDLMEFLSIDAAGPSKMEDRIDFGAWMKKYVDRCGSDATLLGKKIESDIAIPDGTLIRMDERLVERAFDNLVHNAFRYTNAGGIVRIAAATEGPAIVVRFTDNGPGIEEKDIPYIFDMFYRGTPSRQTQGMGLGLAVVKNIIDSHEWTIAVTSTPGLGTSFEVAIPRSFR